MATGNIAVSLFVEAGKKLDGIFIKELLDRILLLCCPEKKVVDFIPQNEINAELANYQQQYLKDVDYEDYAQGQGESAFIYYRSEEELVKYLNNPDQNEYTHYKQIYLVDASLNVSPANPLNALRHDARNNLTGKIDLENPKYRLIFKEQEQGGLQIEVKVNGKRQSNKNKVKRKDILEITYSQKYRVPKTITGTWNDIKEERSDSIVVDDANGTVTINPIKLGEERRPVAINVIDEISNSPVTAQIFCTNSYKNLSNPVSNNQIPFMGDDIGEEWNIRVEASGYKIEQEKFKPETENSITVKLVRQKIIEIQPIDEDTKQPISDYSLIIFDGWRDRNPDHLENQPNKIVFVGREIEKEWYLEIEATNYYDKNMDRFCPNDYKEGEIISVKMEKRRQIITSENSKNDNPNMTISFDAEKHGKLIDYQKYHKETVPSEEHKYITQKYSPKYKADIFYKFKGWKITKPCGENNCYIYVAKFEPIISNRILLISIFSIL
jgi:hypothetical protein